MFVGNGIYYKNQKLKYVRILRTIGQLILSEYIKDSFLINTLNSEIN